MLFRAPRASGAAEVNFDADVVRMWVNSDAGDQLTADVTRAYAATDWNDPGLPPSPVRWRCWASAPSACSGGAVNAAAGSAGDKRIRRILLS